MPGLYPNYLKGQDTIVVEYSVPTGSFAAGDRLVGATSGATGWFSGYLTNPARVIIGGPVAGLGGVPFLPNETIQKVGDASKRVIVATSPQAYQLGIGGDLPSQAI